MNAALRRLYALWHTPGREMAAGWWEALGVAQWKQPYADQAVIRPALDRLLAHRLGQEGGRVPSVSPLAEALLADDARRGVLCLALGLWALNCPDYLLLGRYREALLPVLDERALSQLHAVLPMTPRQDTAVMAPEALLETANRAGATWLAASRDPGLLACRLFWDPVAASDLPVVPPEPVLQKLERWL